MSMTQEEIEALMNSNDFEADDEENQENENDVDLDELLNEVINDGSTSQEDDHAPENIDDILAGIDGIVDDEPKTDEDKKSQEESKTKEENQNNQDKTDDIIPEEVIEKKIDEGIYPLPVSEEHKVVSQLNKVAEDSEQKASQIFDVLSFILDENDLVTKNNNDIKTFIQNQIELLETLSNKFPKIDLFKQNLEQAKEAITKIDDIDSFINEENTKVFEAMELMQFHDINRQKIERVMTVIKKLTTYLNQLFEDDSNKPEVQIAKHISGDDNETVSEEDLDKLINDFSKEV
jgi:hypothetical protein